MGNKRAAEKWLYLLYNVPTFLKLSLIDYWRNSYWILNNPHNWPQNISKTSTKHNQNAQNIPKHLQNIPEHSIKQPKTHSKPPKYPSTTHKKHTNSPKHSQIPSNIPGHIQNTHKYIRSLFIYDVSLLTPQYSAPGGWSLALRGLK